jgi:cellobiose phosphorylase
MNRRNFIALTASATASGAVALPTAGSGAQGNGAEKVVATGNDYFEFSQDGTECLIKRYDTPVQWLNLLNNGRLVAWVAHDGTVVESCLIDNKDNRLTNPQSGYIYIRDTESGDYFMLNRPAENSAWSAVQGLGYTRVVHSALDLTVSATYFVPRDDDVMVWSISIKNKSSKVRTIDVFSVVEWCLGDVNYSSELPGGDFHSIYNNFKKISFDGEILYGNNYSWGMLGAFQGQKVWPYTAFLTSSLPVKAFDCDKTSFFGRRIDTEHPAAVAKGQCASQPAFGFTGFPLGVLQNSVHLGAGAEQKFAVIAGMVREAGEASAIRKKYAREGATDQAFQQLKQFWTEFTARSLWVDTPEKEIDRLVNIWIKFQHRNSMLENLNTKRVGFGIWCPAYSYGSGRLSDIRETGNVTCDLEAIREDILDYLHGGPLLLESDLKMKWEEPKCTPPPPPYPHDGRGLWPYPVCWYLKETGDFAFLDTPIANHGQVPSAPKTGTLSLFETMKHAVEWALSGLSERGLPRLDPGYGDWNDALNLISRDGRGESILTATELCYMLRECAEIASAHGKQQEAQDWTAKYNRIKTAVNTYAWDGEWYVRAFTDEGEAVGSSKNKEGKIYHSVQAYAVLSGVAEGDRAARCLESVDRLLMTEYGPRICAPAYTKPAYDVGIVGDFGPGWRENGGIWNRTTGWTVMANCVANRANQAFEMYRKASINHPSKDTDRFWLPPYVYPEFLVGEGPAFGRAEFQWCVGKAGTMWRAYNYFILGIRPVLNGLLVDPKIPDTWEGYRVKRQFRRAFYEIVVANPNGMNSGVRSLDIDGQHVPGNVIPPQEDGRTHIVKVILGS